ncbi:hypothetical protein [Microbacterium sp. P5_E9]
MTIVDPHTSADLIEQAIPIGPNGDDVISKVPFAMTSPLHVPAERYCSNAFLEFAIRVTAAAEIEVAVAETVAAPVPAAAEIEDNVYADGLVITHV